MSKKKETPIAYDAEYYEYQTIDYASDTDVSEIESEISEKNEAENTATHDLEEYNNKYSFIKKTKKEVKSNKKTNEKKLLEEEEYISD